MAPEKIFHYTTPDGLIGIVSKNCLWATSVFYLNDSHEMIGGIQIARKQLETLRINSADKDQANRIEWLLNDTRRVGTVQSMTAYVCSLSSKEDQLSQWRAYCRGGGFSIGFPADQLREAVAAQSFSLDECVYSDAAQEKLMRETIDRVAVPWILGTRLPVSEDENRFKVSNKLTWELVRAASRLKHQSFEEESEYRIVSMPERKYDPEKLHFRPRGGIIIPYTTIDLPNTSDFWGRVSIVVGPTPHPNESKISVHDLVRRFRGHTVGIEITHTPFREW